MHIEEISPEKYICANDEMFVVYPEDCNFHTVEGKMMVHGGIILKRADRLAACTLANMFNRINRTDLVPLTVGVNNCQFYKACKLGDIIRISALVKTPLTNHRIDVEVAFYNDNETIFEGTFSFCSFKQVDGKYELSPHGLNK